MATGDFQGHALYVLPERTFTRGDLQGHRKISGHSPSNSIHALRRKINEVTMLACDVKLRHFSKTMLYYGYTRKVYARNAYSYLLYTLGVIKLCKDAKRTYQEKMTRSWRLYLLPDTLL